MRYLFSVTNMCYLFSLSKLSMMMNTERVMLEFQDSITLLGRLIFHLRSMWLVGLHKSNHTFGNRLEAQTSKNIQYCVLPLAFPNSKIQPVQSS